MKIQSAIIASAFLSLLTPAFNANAATWVRGAESNSMVASIDAASLVKVPGGYRKAWVKAEFSTPQQNPKTKYEMQLWYFDCQQMKSALFQYTEYDESGNNLNTVTGKFSADRLQESPPESVGVELLNSACRLAPR